jgi:HPt (histidine-containing phosphotransfer) domain-containing protein
MNSAFSDAVSSGYKEQVLKLETLDALRDFIGSEPLRHYLADFIENTAHNLQRMGTAIAAEDGSRVRHLAHKLKGSSGNIGALKLAWCCVELEAASAEGYSHAALILKYQHIEGVFQDTQTAIQSYIDRLASVQAGIA